MKKLIWLLSMLATLAKAQTTFPVNGPHNIIGDCYAFTNCVLYIDYQTKVEKATLVIRAGRVEGVGVGIAIPKDAKVTDLGGKWVYPGFIDLYSNYGINPAQEKRGNAGGQQFISSKAGAYNWNEAVHPETDASSVFSADDNKAKGLREAGFGAVVTGSHDGIFRGSCALVSTGSGRENELVLRERVAHGMSFNKGTSTQDYPSSLMGSIALIRQTYLDAKWYSGQQKETNLSLDALNQLSKFPAIFAANDKLSVLRASRIANEFGMTYLVSGAGDEYQRATEIKQAGVPLVIPINFPKAFDVDDPLDAALVSTADMKHWELAPANAMLLDKQKIEFAITMSGCENATEFLKNLRKAVQYGLTEAAALRALTEVPARWLKATKDVGSLRVGAWANLVICTGNIFGKEALITEVWTKGKRYVVNRERDVQLLGLYRVRLPQFDNFRMRIDGEPAKPGVTLLGPDTIKGSITGQFGMLLISFKPNRNTADVRINAWVDERDTGTHQARHITGKATMPDGAVLAFEATLIDSVKQIKKPDSTRASELGEVIYPFTDYGSVNLPATETVIFRNATVWSNEKEGVLTETDVAIQNGKILMLGKKLSVAGAREIDATGKHLTSGIIDEHSHIAIAQGVNEGTQAVTSEVRIGDVVYSEDVNIYRQLSGGVTASQLLHGSANPIGGQSAMIKLRWGMPPERMKIEGADGFIKFALGENVKQSNWGDRATVRYPQTRMGVEQVMYDAFIRAKAYARQLHTDRLTRRDLELDALNEILERRRFITCHSYVQSEINMLMHVADSMGFRVNTFTHILEGYKVADKMKRHGVHASTFADWWAYKYEVTEAIPYNAAIMTKVGLTVAINSDDAEMGRRLNQEAAKTMKYGGMTEEEAWKMVTLNPAIMLHLDKRMGSIKAGKDADVVLWTSHPLSIYAKPEYVFVDGTCYFSLDRDRQLREQGLKERQRLIQKLMAARQNGEKTEKRVSREEESYQCEH